MPPIFTVLQLLCYILVVLAIFLCLVSTLLAEDLTNDPWEYEDPYEDD